MKQYLKHFTPWLALMLLCSCASNMPKPAADHNTVEKMQTVIDEAVTSNTNNPDTTAVNAALLPPLKIELPASSKKQLDPRFDLVINNAPANQVLMGIADGTRYSMLIDNAINGSITLNLKDVTVFEALDAIREIYGYEYKVDGTRIFIEPQHIQTRVFQVNYIVGQRKGSSDIRVNSGSMSGGGGQQQQNNQGGNAANGTNNNNGGGGQQSAQMVSSSITTSSENNFWKDLEASLNGLLSSENGKKIVINTQSGLIMVRAMPDEIRNIESFLRLMQVNIERQVILEAKILDVELNKNSQEGINWSVFGSSNSTRGTLGTINTRTRLSTSDGTIGNNTITGTTGSTIFNEATTALGGPVFALSLQGANFAALLNFLESQGNVNVLSSPRIATINNQKAVLKVGTDEFFVTNVQQNQVTNASTTNNSPSVTLQSFFSGIALDVTPQIDKDDNIILHIHPSISSVTTVNKTLDLGSSGSLNLPLASNSVSETDSIVRTRDGNVIAIGGLMTESVTGNNARVPGLSKLKGIGKLFTQEGKLTTKKELVILLKATVVQGEESWNQDLLDSRKRLRKLSSH